LSYRFKAQGSIYYGSYEGSHRAYKVCIGECELTQTWLFGAVLYSCALDNITNAYIGRACHFATFAVKTHVEALVEELRAFSSQTLSIWSGLLWAWVERVYRSYGAIDGADGTLGTLFKVVFAILFHRLSV